MNCPDCDTKSSCWHRAGCTWEQCPYCGTHLVDCDCWPGVPPLDDRIRWAGDCPLLEACLKFDIFEKQMGAAWVPCGFADGASQPAVSRLFRECYWDRDQKRFERTPIPGARTRRLRD